MTLFEVHKICGKFSNRSSERPSLANNVTIWNLTCILRIVCTRCTSCLNLLDALLRIVYYVILAIAVFLHLPGVFFSKIVWGHFYYSFGMCWYKILSAEGDGSKIYVACIAFRDPVCEDIIEAYQIPANSFADKCICVVSRSPSFQVLKDALEELFILCFSPAGSR